MTEYDYATDIAVKQEEAFASGRNEGILVGLQQGRDQGAYEKALETAKILLSYGDSPEKVAVCTKLPLDVVQNLIQVR